MATYGTRDATQFLLPSVESNERYYTLVDRDTGKITLKRINKLNILNESLDATVGTIESSGPNAGKFVPEAGATPTEKQAFSQQPQAVKTVKDKANETVTKGKIKEGANPQTAQAESNKLVGNPNEANSPTTEESQQALGEELEKSKTLSRRSFPKNLRYPADLQIEHQDVIKFNMLEFVPRKLDKEGNQGLGGFEQRKSWKERIIGNVYLPIPAGISDTNSVTWGSDSITPLEAGLAGIVDSIIADGAAAGAETAGNKFDSISQNSGDVKSSVRAYFTQQAIGKSNILSRTQGAIQNPNMELLFSAPSLRPFSFTFKLSARGTKDRDQIRQIIRFFKQGMAVQRTQSQLFLKAPHTFKIEYLHRNQEHNYLNLIKECALLSFTVNYTPDGTYMTFADGLMTSYEISMQFQELEPIYNDDYGNIDGKSIDTNIGY
jgi:hypothetical protein